MADCSCGAGPPGRPDAVHSRWCDAYLKQWPIPMKERARLALAHEPKASSSPDGFRLATCVVCERPMVTMWHLWVNVCEKSAKYADVDLVVHLIKEIHMCHACATDIYGAPVPPASTWVDVDRTNAEIRG